MTDRQLPVSASPHSEPPDADCLPVLQSCGQVKILSALLQGDLLLCPDQRGWEQEDRLLQAPLGLCSSELPPPLLSAACLAPQLGLLKPQLQRPRLPGSAGHSRDHSPALAAMFVPASATRTETHPPTPAPAYPGDLCWPYCGLCSPNFQQLCSVGGSTCSPAFSLQASLPWPREPP